MKHGVAYTCTALTVWIPLNFVPEAPHSPHHHSARQKTWTTLLLSYGSFAYQTSNPIIIYCNESSQFKYLKKLRIKNLKVNILKITDICSLGKKKDSKNTEIYKIKNEVLSTPQLYS